MVRTVLIGVAVTSMMFIRGLGCAPDGPRTAEPTRAATPVTRVPVPTQPPPAGTSPTPGSAGCGLPSAAFCDTFSYVSPQGGRSGELDPARWSVSRTVGNLDANNLMPFPATPVGPCKAGVGSVTPDRDLVVCDSSSGHQGQLLTAMSAQNYALLSMRPRQPFDFSKRTGTIVYNVDAVTQGDLSWWTSLYVTDQPDTAAANARQVMGMLPRNGIGVNFDNTCSTNGLTKSGVGDVFAYNNYVETRYSNTNNPICIATQRGALNHIEVRLSQTNIEVWGSDASTDGGRTFPNLRSIFASPISLSFTRGYVHFQQAERAPVKYASNGISPGYANNYWSNIGFDGPVVPGEVGYSVPDALTVNPTNGALNVGYGLLSNPFSMYGCCSGNAQVPVAALNVDNVNITAVSAARLSFAVNYSYTDTFTTSSVVLRYRINGSQWLEPSTKPDYTAEYVCSDCPGPNGGGGVLYSFAIDKSLLHSGTNTIAFEVDNSFNGYPPIVNGVDLLTYTGYSPP